MVSVAGNSYRYNALQIDGAANNDLFGLAGSAGAPGGAAETQPISLDAIQEIQLVVSPYDVRQGGFSGGGINAITKSGTNSVPRHGVLLRPQPGLGRQGRRRSRRSRRSRTSRAAAASAARWCKNRAFFFGTVDYGAQGAPDRLLGEASAASTFGNAELVNRFIEHPREPLRLRSRRRIRSGEFSKATDSDKYFVRGRLQRGEGPPADRPPQLHRRAATTSASRRLTAFRTPGRLLPAIDQQDQLHGRPAELARSARASTSCALTYTRVRDIAAARSSSRRSRRSRVDLPRGIDVSRRHREVLGAQRARPGHHRAERRVHADQGAATPSRSARTTSSSSCGTCSSATTSAATASHSLDIFEQGFAQQYDRSFSATSDPLQPAAFKVRQWGFYAGDQWRVQPERDADLRRAHRRADVSRTSRTRTRSRVANFGYATDVVPSDVQWSPRVGFNWDLSGNGTAQIRGGVGLFTGRPAYVWISNQFGNTGIDFTRIGAAQQRQQPHPVRRRSAQSADDGDRRDRLERSRTRST